MTLTLIWGISLLEMLFPSWVFISTVLDSGQNRFYGNALVNILTDIRRWNELPLLDSRGQNKELKIKPRSPKSWFLSIGWMYHGGLIQQTE